MTHSQSTHSHDSDVVRRVGWRDHILHKSMWAGSTKLGLQVMAFDSETDSLAVRHMDISGALDKIIDEVIVNATDHHRRHAQVKNLRISIDSQGVVSVYNDGPGFRIEMIEDSSGSSRLPAETSDSVSWSVEVAVSEPMSGTNFGSVGNADATDSVVGGTNGLGVKLTNFFSKYFCVETVDPKSKRYYRQEFRDNNNPNSRELPVVKNFSEMKRAERTPHTLITFLPDYERLNFHSPPSAGEMATMMEVLRARCMSSAAANPRLKISLQGKAVRCTVMDLTQRMCGSDDQSALVSFDVAHPQYPWQVVVGASPGGSPINFSIVNGVQVGGGDHLRRLRKLIVADMKQRVLKKLKKAKVGDAALNNHLVVVMCGVIPNPDFQGQTKNGLMVPRDLLLEYNLDRAGLDRLWAVMEEVFMFAAANSTRIPRPAKNRARRLNGIKKYWPATLAGGKQRATTSLMVCEGDSAAGTVREGIGGKNTPLNFDQCGVFSLQGVPLNAFRNFIQMKNRRPLPNSRLLKTERLMSLIQVLGLDFRLSYLTQKERNTLRYGRVVGVMDQDEDGKGNIFGLLLPSS